MVRAIGMEAVLSDELDALAVQNAQRQGARRATLDMMRAKRRKPKEFTAELADEEVTFLYAAIGNVDYDKLLTECPPTTAQRAEGAVYNQDKFAPELLSRVCVEPKLTAEEWTEIWTSPDWSRGETGNLFYEAVNLCGQGLNLTPTAAG